MAWVKPTSFSDPSSIWSNEANAYDDNTATYAETTSDQGGYLELILSSITCNKIRLYAVSPTPGGDVDPNILIDVYYSGAWHNIKNGTIAKDTWVEVTIGSTQAVTKARVSGNTGFNVELKEFNFNSIIAPTVTTQAVSAIGSVTATGNGNITALGGENATKRGVCYNTTGSPTIADDVFEEDGDFSTGAFTASMTGLSPGVKYYVKAYAINSAGTGYGAEVDFTTDKVAPTVTTQDPTDVLPTTVTGNGNITASGGENATVRGFKYGLTQTNTWSISDNGSFSAGAYTKGLTGLDANTTYWIRAYATNSIGTSYGDWVEFQTAAAGVIPTGTDLFIAADLSGYSYQLMRSETDDGETYTAYFVISTDLTNKQGLAFYKRILDLHLYFMSESSGTATIYVKRDSEAEWQTVGTVSLTGSADIIIPHLAPDIRAKHFLFKISASNFFRFLGILFEYLSEDLR